MYNKKKQLVITSCKVYNTTIIMKIRLLRYDFMFGLKSNIPFCCVLYYCLFFNSIKKFSTYRWIDKYKCSQKEFITIIEKADGYTSIYGYYMCPFSFYLGKPHKLKVGGYNEL